MELKKKMDKAIILAAGMSSRMKRKDPKSGQPTPWLVDAQNRPKSMIRLGQEDRPFLTYLLYHYYSVGVRKIALVLNDKDDLTQAYYTSEAKDMFLKEIEWTFVYQRIPEGRSKPMGTAQALEVALDALPDWNGDCFMVSNSDNLYSREVMMALIESEHSNVMPAYKASQLGGDPEKVKNYAILDIEDHILRGILEKPTPAQLALVEEPLVSMNIYKLNYEDIFPILSSIEPHPVRGEKELPTAIQMLSNSKKVFCIPWSESVPDLTSVKDLTAVSEELKTIKIKPI